MPKFLLSLVVFFAFFSSLQFLGGPFQKLIFIFSLLEREQAGFAQLFQ